MREISYRRRAKALATARARKRAAILGIDSGHIEIWVRRTAVTPCPCSRHCCGNPRRYGEGAKRSEIEAPWERDI